MLFKQPLWAPLADGTVTVAFRRWRRPTVRVGGTLKIPTGVLAIDALTIVRPEKITAADARRSGAASRAELLDALADREGDLYRIDFHYAGLDPRIELRGRDELSEHELAEIRTRLLRLDARSACGPWTTEYLQLVAAQPEVRAPDLAAGVGRETQPFKLDIRKLKSLGLTESLRVGYRLSPRGRAYLAHIEAGIDVETDA